MGFIAIFRPPVCTGATPDGWLTWRSGDVVIVAYRVQSPARP